MKNKFTLIELLVVITIISILAAMLLPALNMARKKARTTVCANQIKELAFIAQKYSHDYRDFYFSTTPYARSYMNLLIDIRYLSNSQCKYIDMYYISASFVCPELFTSAEKKEGRWINQNQCYGLPRDSIQNFQTGKGWYLDAAFNNFNKIKQPSNFNFFADSVAISGVTKTPQREYYTRMANTPAAALVHSRQSMMSYLDGHVAGTDLKRMNELGFSKYTTYP